MTFDPVPDPVPTPSPGANSSTPSPRPPPYGDGVENHPAPAPRPDNQKEHHMNTHENHPEQPTGHDADSARDGIGNAPGQPDPELKPLLGLATTELLIRELLARAEVSRIAGEAWPSYRTVDAQPASIEEVLRDHRREWADYFERWTGAVGPAPLTVDKVIAALRGETVPFGRSANPGREASNDTFQDFGMGR